MARDEGGGGLKTDKRMVPRLNGHNIWFRSRAGKAKSENNSAGKRGHPSPGIFQFNYQRRAMREVRDPTS